MKHLELTAEFEELCTSMSQSDAAVKLGDKYDLTPQTILNRVKPKKKTVVATVKPTKFEPEGFHEKLDKLKHTDPDFLAEVKRIVAKHTLGSPDPRLVLLDSYQEGNYTLEIVKTDIPVIQVVEVNKTYPTGLRFTSKQEAETIAEAHYNTIVFNF